jgi:excisionase family DNA binding protein
MSLDQKQVRSKIIWNAEVLERIDPLASETFTEKHWPTPATHISSFLTPEEAATFLGGLHARTVTRWAREGYLPAYPIGEGKRRLWRFLKSDLQSWMLARRSIRSDFHTLGDTLAPSHRCSQQKGSIQ